MKFVKIQLAMGYNKMVKSTKIIGITLINVLSLNAFAYCPSQYENTLVLPMFENSTLVMNSALATVDAQLTALIKFNNERVLSALSVFTK